MSKAILLGGIEGCLCWAPGLSDSPSQSSGSTASPPVSLGPGKPKSWNPCGVICGGGGLCLRGRDVWEGTGQPGGPLHWKGDKGKHRGVSWLPGQGCSTQVSVLLGPQFSSVQLRSVAQSCPTLCDPRNRSTPGLPVHHQLPEFTQTYIHWVGDAIQPSHPLSSPSLPAPNPSQHQSLFQWVNSSQEVAKVLEFQL